MAALRANGEPMPMSLLVEEEEEEEEEDVPEWLHVLMTTLFWQLCRRGHREENRAEECIFCIQCYEVFCPHCTHDVPGHRLLRVRRYVYRSILLVRDMQELNVDVSRIQTYVINGQKGLHLRPMRRSPLFRPGPGAPNCKTCRCWLRNQPNLFCSQAEADVSPDDFSGPEAERRYRNIQPHMLQPREAEPEHEAEAEAAGPPAPAPAPAPEQQAKASSSQANPTRLSFRTRPRKQQRPQRSPFY